MKAIDVCKSLAPLGLILAVYGLFHFLIPELSENIHYSLMPRMDIAWFGQLPTITLQHWLWHGHVLWYDYVLYLVYVLHYVLVVVLALLIYKYRKAAYTRFSLTYILASFTAFIADIAYPTAPPWLASQNGYIPHITRITEFIYASLGVHNYPALYNQLAPNPISALPSLHAAYAVLFSLFAFRLFGKKWGALSLLYPFCIILGVVYMGEHYVIDVVAGALLAGLSFVLTPLLWRYGLLLYRRYASPQLVSFFRGD